MKLKLLVLATMLMFVTKSAHAEENICGEISVPPAMAIGNAPNETILVQISTEGDLTQLKLLTYKSYMGLAAFASMCTVSGGNILCDKPLMGKGTVVIRQGDQTLDMEKVEMSLEKSQISTKILGTKSNLKITQVSCDKVDDLIKRK